jgi:hypothetical protein
MWFMIPLDGTHIGARLPMLMRSNLCGTTYVPVSYFAIALRGCQPAR